MATSIVGAADPIACDPRHYTVEFENERIRVLRIRYGPHEKSPMHSHPALVAICTSTNAAINLPSNDWWRKHAEFLGFRQRSPCSNSS